MLLQSQCGIILCVHLIFRDEILNELVILMSDLDMKMLVCQLLKEFVGEV